MDSRAPCGRASRAIRVACFLALALTASRTANTDGCYFPERAYKKLPAIPLQRALVTYRNGSERLVLESALDAEGQSFGWVIPIPAKPTELGEATPGLLKTLSGAIQPAITHDLSRGVTFVAWLALAIGVWLVVVLAWAPRSRFVPIGLLVAVPLCMMLLPALAGRSKDAPGRAAEGGAGIEGVRIEEAARIGNYEVTVLSADRASALGEWLSANAFSALPQEGASIVEDYIKDGWYFVAAKLARDGSGLALPHPIALTFESEEPVYPLRLTALAGSPVYLEILIVADGRAHCSQLPLESSDTYEHRAELKYTYRSKKAAPGYIGKNHRQMIGHPAVLDDLWDGCVMSKFAGRLGPSKMNEDMRFKLLPARPYRKHLYSSRGARETGLIWSIMIACLAVPIAIIVFYGRLTCAHGRVFMLTRVVAPALGGFVLLWGSIYVCLPKTEVETSRHRKWRPAHTTAANYDAATGDIVGSNPAVAASAPETAARAFEEYFRYKYSANQFGGGRVQMEDSPGNYTLLRDDRGLVLRTYDRQGFPYDVPVAGQSEGPDVPSILDRWLPLLKDRDRRHEARRRLAATKDMRAIGAIIESMDRGRRYTSYNDNVRIELARLTGFVFWDRRDYSRCYKLWARWWEASKGKSRSQVLREALEESESSWGRFKAAQELALVGDDAGVQVLREHLAIEKHRLDAAGALAKLGREEGHEALERWVMDKSLRPRHHDARPIQKLLEVGSPRAARFLLEVLGKEHAEYYYGTIVHGLRFCYPRLVAPVVLRHLRQALAHGDGDRLIANDLDLLGPIIREEPPINLADTAALDRFVEAAEVWCASHPSE